MPQQEAGYLNECNRDVTSRHTVRRKTVKPTGITAVIRWDENAGLRRDAIRSQVIDALEAQEIKETGNEED